MADDAYKQAGVDIDAGEALVERIKPLAKATAREGVVGGIGGFGGLFSLMGRYRDPVLVSGTDGVVWAAIMRSSSASARSSWLSRPALVATGSR